MIEFYAVLSLITLALGYSIVALSLEQRSLRREIVKLQSGVVLLQKHLEDERLNGIRILRKGYEFEGRLERLEQAP